MALAKNRVVIITGTSRGLGAALAQQLLAEHTLLIGIARTTNPDLVAKAQALGVRYHAITADLSQAEEVRATQQKLVSLIPTDAQEYWLINNAGTVDPVALCNNLDDSAAVAAALQLNIGAVISLTASFLQCTATLSADKRLLNISSGAGRRPVAGWAVYGSTKAALDFYTQTVAAEGHNIRCCSLAPGVIDTAMQAHIRDQKRDDFPGLSRFIDLHQKQQLSSAETTASSIIKYLESPKFGTQVIDDIRHYL